jgi:hypothetical protein
MSSPPESSPLFDDVIMSSPPESSPLFDDVITSSPPETGRILRAKYANLRFMTGR